MKKYIFFLFNYLFLIPVVAACTNTSTDSTANIGSQNTYPQSNTSTTYEVETGNDLKLPVLVYTESEGMIIASRTVWTVENCEIGDFEMLYGAEGPSAAKPVCWNGDDEFIFEQTPSLYIDNGVTANLISSGNPDNYVILSDNCKVEVNQGSAGNTYKLIWIGDDGTEKIKVIDEVQSQLYAREIPQSCQLLAAAHDMEHIYLFFPSLTNDEACTIYYLAYNLKTDDYNWFSCNIPDQFALDVYIYFTQNNTLYNEGKLYISGGTTLLYLDVENNNITIMDNVINSSMQLVPNTSQTNLMGLAPPVSLAGAYNNIIVFYLPVYEEDGNAHAVFFAMKRDEIIGAIDVFGQELNIYDENFELQNTVSFTETKLSAIPISFSWQNMLLYGKLILSDNTSR